MKTEHLGLVITKVPGIESITVCPTGDKKGDVQIWIKMSGSSAVPFTIDELNQVIDALEVVRTHARFMEASNGAD